MRPTVMALAMGAALLTQAPAQARITRLEIIKVEPAFGGRTFGNAGAFERVTGIARGEVDPKSPANAIIQDIALAPRNARGMVEYATEIDILRPADQAKSNDLLLFNILNRGNKGAQTLFNADAAGTAAQINNVEVPGDGWLQRQGYTLIWFGWQHDVLAGDGRMRFMPPVAKNPDGSPVTGTVRSEIIVQAPANSVNISTGWFPAMSTDSYPTVSTDNRAKLADGFLPTLTVRQRESAPRVEIPAEQWSFSDCTTSSDKKLCLQGGFQPGRIYEIIYRAKNPVVGGLGFAAARDLASFLRAKDKDDAGTPNPVAHGKDVKTIVMGSSQSGRFVRSMIALGFNKAEAGGRAFDGALPHIGGGLMPLNVRFSQPSRAWGSVVDRMFPAYDFPFTYARQTDPLTGRTQGLLDRCTADNTCPKIFHAATALEIWDGRQSLGFTDPLGTKDVADPPGVRSYIMASTQHSAAALPLATKAPFGACVQQPNPNPHTWTMRALLTDFAAWIVEDKRPPASNVPRIADATLVAADAVRFPAVPATSYGGVERPAMRYLGATNPLHVYDRGPQYRPADTSGIETIVPPKIGTAAYGVLVPQVDADGNDLAGIRSLFQLVPIGTYTGWNQYRADWFPDQPCTLVGSFVPFAATKAERIAAGDPRLSLEERYPTPGAYITAMRIATDKLISARFLLPDDAARLVAEAEAKGVRSGP
jgi:hypothetical protein